MKYIYNKSKLISTVAICFALSATTISCKKFLDVEPKDKLVKEQTYRNVYDADAAVIGVYGKFMKLAEQYVILNELRADLLTVTRNSDPNLRELNTHQVSADNPYVNPKLYYEVILNCNDVLKNFDEMLESKKFTIEQYNQRYSDVGALRSWVYLQLGIHYGSIPYVTDPLENIDDLKDASKFPKISFNELLDKLILFTTGLPFKELYPTGTSLTTAVDGSTTEKFFINKNILIGDLHLWKGNYKQSATAYKEAMTAYDNLGNDNFKFDTYKVKYSSVTDNNDIAVGYLRFREQDITTLVNSTTQGWRSIFTRNQDVLWNTEWIWSLPFNKNFLPENPFINLFSINGGKYLVKPSAQAIHYWDSQVQKNGVPYDARKTFTFTELGGEPVITKYISKYLNPFTLIPNNLLEKEGQWFLFRAAGLHLRFAEAANRDDRHKLAAALLNQGILAAYDNTAITDKTNLQRTNDEQPYDFDARNANVPYFRDTWHRNAGIRGRAYLPSIEVVGDSTSVVEDFIIQEAALELAYEGNRWPDLVRIALRRNDPSFLAEKVYQKHLKEGNAEAAAIRSKLMNPDNWYLPFKWN